VGALGRTPSSPETSSLDDHLRLAAERAVEAAAERLARPTFVSQRTVLAVVGLPARDFLRGARAGAFASSKARRLILARTDDVVAYVDAHHVEPHVAPANDFDAALARIGARRVGGSK
jgi:hypothetical protein